MYKCAIVGETLRGKSKPTHAKKKQKCALRGHAREHARTPGAFDARQIPQAHSRRQPKGITSNCKPANVPTAHSRRSTHNTQQCVLQTLQTAIKKDHLRDYTPHYTKCREPRRKRGKRTNREKTTEAHTQHNIHIPQKQKVVIEGWMVGQANWT